MSLSIKWEDNQGIGYKAHIGEFTLIAVPEAVIDLSLNVTWMVLDDAGKTIASGRERVKASLTQIHKMEDPLANAKLKAEKALLEVVGAQEIESWLTEK